MTLENILGHTFQRKTLLINALTPPVLQQRKNGKIFERLEFLGDRVLGLIIAEALYVRYAHDEEGKLAKRLSYLASREFCDIVATRIELANYIPIGLEELHGTSVLSNCIEAVIAALYIDGGLEAAQKFVLTYWADAIGSSDELPKDSKTLVQEWVQKRGMDIPVYTQLERSGPDHAPLYKLEVRLQNGWTASAEGKNKKQAERNAALKMWQIIVEKGEEETT